MLRSITVAALLASASANVVKLTEENYDTLTNDKTVFLKMFAPWCGHCKSMAGDWEKLAEEWKGHGIALVGEVDCTEPSSESLCERFNVEGFPTLLYGDPTAPEDFQGGRDYASLSAFAKTFLDKPVCSVTKEDACDAEQKKLLHELKKKSKDELLSTVEEVESKLKAYQQDLDDFIDEINIQYDLKTNEFNQKITSLHSESNYKWVQQILQKVHGVMPKRPQDDSSLFGEDELMDEL